MKSNLTRALLKKEKEIGRNGYTESLESPGKGRERTTKKTES